MSGVGAHLTRLPVVAFTDPHNARLLWIAAGGLFAVGVLLAIGTFVWWRRAGNDHPALAKLESMRPARRPRPAMAAASASASASAPSASSRAAPSGVGAAVGPVVAVDDVEPVELAEHPSGRFDAGADADVTSVGEHPAGATEAADDNAVAEPGPGIDPLLRPVEATD